MKFVFYYWHSPGGSKLKKQLFPAFRRIFPHAQTIISHLHLSLSYRQPETAAMVSFPALTGAEGLKALNEHLLTRSYVVG
jgi:hypothetical protein